MTAAELNDPEVGDFVLVSVDGGKPGQVMYFEQDPFDKSELFIGISLAHEGKRVDEWQRIHIVEKLTPEDAKRIAAMFQPRASSREEES